MFYIGQTFDKPAPPAAAAWCNMNNATIKKVDNVRTIVALSQELTQTELLQGYEAAVQNHLDATAQSRGYDNTYTCLSYPSSTDPVCHKEANAFNVWRDQVWRKCHDILNSVMAGECAPPSLEELLAMLPVIDWN
jgi:hypothetical protein